MAMEASKEGLLRLDVLRDKFEIVDKEHARLVHDSET